MENEHFDLNDIEHEIMRHLDQSELSKSTINMAISSNENMRMAPRGMRCAW